MMDAPNPHEALSNHIAAITGFSPLSDDMVPWFSANFCGARHIFRLPESARLAQLRDHEFMISGHIIADVTITEGMAGDMLVEVLSVAET